jgi:hypothetical protein
MAVLQVHSIAYKLSLRLVQWLLAPVVAVYSFFIDLWTHAGTKYDLRAHEYKPLEDGEVRLMTLHAGQRHDPIVFDLATVKLSYRPEYEALSYVWGDKDGTERVFLSSGKHLLATRNLVDALRRLRHVGESRVLWVDALCINQRDLEERAAQVTQMGKIYSWASKVLIWLGEEEENEGYRFLRLMDDVHDILSTYSPLYHIRIPSPSTPEETKKSQMLYEDIQSLDVDPLIQLLKRPWFRRAWVVQEVVKSREAVLIWGRTWISWDRMRKVFSYVCVQRDDVFMYASWFRTMNVLCREVGNFRSGETKWDMVRLIHHMSTFDCTDQRDRVYSILGLLRTSILPDYRLSIPDFSKNLVRWIVEDQATLDIFSLAGLSYQSETAGLPSWAPQLGHGFPDMMLFNSLCNATGAPYGLSARRSHMKDSGTAIYGNSMSVSGRLVDTVSQLTSIFDSTYLENGTLDRKITAKMLQDSLDIASKILVPFQVSKFKSFLTALCGDSPNALKQIGKLDDEIAALGKPFLLNVASESRGQWLLENFPLYPGSLNCVQEYLSNRCFGLTKSNHFTILPSKSRAGDSIALIQGSVVPHVVRPTKDNSFLLIGECFVQGIMQGEILKEDTFRWDGITLI